MSLDVHFLFSNMDRFPENFGDVSEEHGERFHMDIKDIDRRYQGRWNTAMISDTPGGCQERMSINNINDCRRNIVAAARLPHESISIYIVSFNMKVFLLNSFSLCSLICI